eukprot:Hpha_TRINITY_DN17562_c0_g1::TRINITY_DN17562_c0_g1_i1::g.92498::m.92498
MSAPAFELGYVTDVEGNLPYWRNYVERSRVLRYAPQGLELTHDGAHFVFGGDVVDKGVGDIRLTRELVALKRRYPSRVWLLVGNRDLNKLRFAAELSPEDLARHHSTIPPPHWDPKAPTLTQRLEGLAKERGCTADECDGEVERLQWMLEATMGCPNTFEFRRDELAELQGVPRASISNDDVVRSMVQEARPGGSLWEYFREACIGAIVGNTIFVHGCIDSRTMGFVPGHSTRFHLPSEPQDGEDLTEKGPRAWVEGLNKFLQKGLDRHEASPLWDSARERRGGEELLALQNRPALWGRSVISNSYSSGGVIVQRDDIAKGKRGIEDGQGHKALRFEGTSSDAEDERVSAWLKAAGISRVVVGHKPSGDCPAVLSAERTGVETVSADTSFSGMRGSVDPRGEAVATVTIEGTSAESNKLRLSGSLRDGRSYDCSFPQLPYDDSERDNPLGREVDGGWWVKVQAGADYLLCRGSGRNVEYKYLPAGSPELAARL